MATICEGCMSCNGTETGLMVEYFVHVDMPIDYDRCGRVLDCMNNDHLANSVTNWHCEDDCRVGTYLHFNSFINNQDRINWCHHETWPELGWDKGTKVFNCPSH